MMRVPRLLSVHVICEPLNPVAWPATAISLPISQNSVREFFLWDLFYRDAKTRMNRHFHCSEATKSSVSA